MRVALDHLVAPWCATAPAAPLTGLTEDSRRLEPGDGFVAVAGAIHDGHDHVRAAVSRGAAAIIAERPVPDPGVPVVVLQDLARLRSALADRFFQSPSAALRCIGITGTNGKTSVAWFVAGLLEQLGEAAGYLGTLGWGGIARLESADLTTADAIECQRRLAMLLDRGARWAVLEVSSHALVQQRVAAVRFRTAVFTNLSRDHLDFHHTMENYARAKGLLFQVPDLETAVINADDPVGRRIAQTLAPGVALLRFGAGAQDVSWSDLSYHRHGIRGRWRTLWGDAPMELPLYGAFSVANAAAALAVLCASGFALDRVAAAFATLPPVPGRMEFFDAPGHPTVVVDFAHTPQALEAALAALRGHCGGRLYCVVGCGGDRDRGKRPLMAAAAERGADVVCLTSDNPRSESPEAIIEEMAAGLAGDAVRIADRAEAIRWAVATAGAADLVLIAGKGHEAYQEIGGTRFEYSDRDYVARLLREGV